MYKKIFMGIAAAAALTLVSCSSDDLNSVSDNSSKNEAISFDGYLGRSAVAVNGSRGSELTKDALKGGQLVALVCLVTIKKLLARSLVLIGSTM